MDKAFSSEPEIAGSSPGRVRKSVFGSNWISLSYRCYLLTPNTCARRPAPSYAYRQVSSLVCRSLGAGKKERRMIRREDIPEHHMTTHQCHNTAKNNDEEKHVATVCLRVSVLAAVLAVCYLWKLFYCPDSNYSRNQPSGPQKTMRYAHPPNFWTTLRGP